MKPNKVFLNIFSSDSLGTAFEIQDVKKDKILQFGK